MSERSQGVVVAMLAFTLCASCGREADPKLYLNLFPVAADGEDPFAGVIRLGVSVPGGPDSWRIDDFGSQGEFGPINTSSPCRLEVEGQDGGGQVLSWGFSPPIDLASGSQKATLFFTRNLMAVANAGPPLVDPDTGLGSTGVPVSLRMGASRGTVAFNHDTFYFQMDVEDHSHVGTDQDLWAGDAVVLLLDFGHQGILSDQVVLVLSAEQVSLIWPQSLTGLVTKGRLTDTGYTVFVAANLNQFNGNGLTGPHRLMGMGVQVRDAQPVGAPMNITNWPAGWASDDPSQHVYSADGDGTIALKTRLLDARHMEGNDFSSGPGIEEFGDSGAVPLSNLRDPTKDVVKAYALWDSNGLMLALRSDDDVFCTQARGDGDRDGIRRDDAVELVLGREAISDLPYRALFGLTGATAYDRIGGGTWTPSDIYFRFDLNGPTPDNDCQAGKGFTFKVRIPWSDLGYLHQGPDAGEVFIFDLVVYDNDRGARTVTAFSPMGPTEDSQAMGELRLFKY